ncbi:unnamed protein product [Linum trigynum]|uniref:Uncharacterized protein n=1 Tax=Linum trigynum TaxID=586398 RepID=A0AAV2DX76_9ROSI
MKFSHHHDDFDYCDEVSDFMEALASAGAYPSYPSKECCLVRMNISKSPEEEDQLLQDQVLEALPPMPNLLGGTARVGVEAFPSPS